MYRPDAPVLFLAITIIVHLGLEIGAHKPGPSPECLETQKNAEKNWPEINDHVFIFYYHWYRNITYDNNTKSQWYHASGSLRVDEKKVFYNVSGDDISSTYFPLLGAYSSNDVNTVDQHFRWIRSTGIGVVALSWKPPMYTPGKKWPEYNFTMLFDAAHKYGLKIAFLVEKLDPGESKKGDYDGVTFGGDIVKTFCEYVMANYGNHPALYKMYRHQDSKKAVPLYFLSKAFDGVSDWAIGLKPNGAKSVRGTDNDGFFARDINTNSSEIPDAVAGGFDAVFKYRGPAGKALQKKAESNSLLYIPSVNPGYDDRRVRSGVPITGRENGTFYENGFMTVINRKIAYMSITSFNEWHESTQIEPSVQNKKIAKTAYDPFRMKKDVNFKYKNYPGDCPYFFLDLTRQYVAQHLEMLKKEGLITRDPQTSTKEPSDSSD